MNKTISIMSPKHDYCFKELMHDKDILCGFLMAVLNLKQEEINSIIFLDPHLHKNHENDKQGILDVRLLLNFTIEINIEIQLFGIKFWPERSTYYLTKMYSGQLMKGDLYKKLNKCIHISILDFNLFKDRNNFYTKIHLRDDQDNVLYTDKLEIHIIELPKLPKDIKDASDILLWAKFFNAKCEEEFKMLAIQNSYIDQAFKKLMRISNINYDEVSKAEYEAKLKAIRDYNSCLLESLETKWKLVSNLIYGNMELEMVAKYTEIPLEDIIEFASTLTSPL